MHKLKITLRHWLPLALVTTALCGLVYLAVQQVLRQNANDPQIQLAQDAATVLERGGTAESVLPTAKVDVGASLAPFMIVHSDTGEALASSGLLRGQIPALPGGVLQFVREHGEDRVTWQPEPGVRIAAVVARFRGNKPGFVLAGRSLREVEKRVDKLTLPIVAAWVVTLVASLVLVILCELFLADDRRRA